MLLRKMECMFPSQFATDKMNCVAYLQGAMRATERLFPAIKRKHQWKNLSIVFCDDPNADFLGRAWQSSSCIEINLGLSQDFLDTVIHELAHIVQPLMYGEGEDDGDDSDHPILWEMAKFDIEEAYNHGYHFKG